MVEQIHRQLRAGNFVQMMHEIWFREGMEIGYWFQVCHVSDALFAPILPRTR